MEKEIKIHIVFWLIFILLISGVSYYYISPFDKDNWCERNKPMFNISNWNNKVAYCYGEGWDKYCKISYPNDCINIR